VSRNEQRAVFAFVFPRTTQCFHKGNSINGRWPESRPGLPKSGTAIPCVLLAEKTRKGGWRAKLVNRALAGPITNSADMPQSARPGQVVELRVGAVSHDGTRIQFHWLPSLGNGRGTKAWTEPQPESATLEAASSGCTS